MAALMAAVSGEAEVARTSARVGEKVDCVQQFLYWATGSPNIYNSSEQLLKLSGFTSVASFPGLRCKDISWYRGKNRFMKAYYLLPFRGDIAWPVPQFLRGHARSVFALGMKPMLGSKGNEK